ncbi:MAG: pitrilysin family protein [Bdellovibrionota bacterium]
MNPEIKQDIIHRYLSNGMEVYLHQTDFAPIVSLQVLVKAGSVDEEESEGGLAHVLEHMLFKGTKKFPELGQIASCVEFEGGDINAYTTFDHTNYYLTAPSEFVFKGTELLIDVVQNSLLLEDELKKELEVIREEIKRGRDNPNSVLSHNLFSTFYEGTRYGRPIIGFENVVENFTREQVHAFYKKWYLPNNMIFIAAGKFDAQELLKHLETLNADFKPQSVPPRVQEPFPKFENKPRCIVERGDWQEVRLQLATTSPTLEEYDMPAWDLFASVLGENDSSRLVRILKEEMLLVTSIDCSCFTPKSPKGLFGVGFFGMAKNATEALKIIVQEIRRLSEVPPSREELLRIINSLKAHRIYSQESMDGITRTAGLSLQTSAKMHFEAQYIERMVNTKATEIQAIAASVYKQIAQGQFVISATLGQNVLEDMSKTHFVDTVYQAANYVHFPAETNAINLSPEKKNPQTQWESKYKINTSSLNEHVKQIEIDLPFGKKLKINFRESTRLPIASGSVVMKGGLCFEPEGKNGVGGLTAGMLCKGTRQQSYRKFVEELEDNASSISAFSSRDLFGLRFDSMSEHALRTIQMLLNCFFSPEFSHTEWERLHKETLEVLIAQKDSPTAYLSKISQPLLYLNHAYANSGIGTETSLNNISRADAISFWKNIFHADEFIFSLAGNFDLKSIVYLIESEFLAYFNEYSEELCLQKIPSIPQATFPTSANSRFAFHEMNREQTHITLSFRAVNITDNKRTALEIAANILAGQGGRLFLDLRDRKSLAYAVSASQTPNVHAGVFTTYIAAAASKTKEAMEGLKFHIERLAHEPPTEDELKRAQKSILGAQSIDSQHHSYQSSQLAMSDVYGLGFDNFLRFSERVNKVTAQMVSDVIKELITNNPPVYAAVGSRETFIPQSEDKLFTWNIL